MMNAHRRRRDPDAAPRARRRGRPTLVWLARGAALAALLWFAGAGCLNQERLPENRPPRTYLALQGENLRPNLYRTMLSWWGSDIDGEVIGYAYRWDGPWHPAPGDSLWWEDTSWAFTTATRDTFDVPVAGFYAERTFTVRAIDDQLLADPQPPSQLFRLENFPPIVSWTDTTRHPTLARPSLPAISFAWTPEDYDGRETIDHALLWLDTQPGEDSAASAVRVVGDTVAAFFDEQFQGRYGQRTVYLQVFDRAATPSNVISWTWTVVPPQGDYLLIDNAGERVAGPQRAEDGFWRDRMDAVFPGSYHVYDVWSDGVFRSLQEVTAILDLFRGVVWYGGWMYDGGAESDRQLREALELAAPALWDYVASGRSVLISAHNALGTEGALSPSFYKDEFGIAEVYTHFVIDEYISDLQLPRSTAVRCGPAVGGSDSLLVAIPIDRTDFFGITAGAEPLFWVDPGVLDSASVPANYENPVYVGAIAERGEGRLALCSTLLSHFRRGDGETAVEGLMRELFAP
jgi:hypothetical protein